MGGFAPIFDAHDAWIENFVANFQGELDGMVAAASARVSGLLRARLALDGDRLARTAGNQAVLRNIDTMFMDAMSRAGFDHLRAEFVAQFPGQYTYFEQIIEQISATLKRPLVAVLTNADEAVLSSFQLSASDGLSAVVEGVAAAAKRKAMLSVGALKFGDLVDTIATTFTRATGEATTLGATSTSMFFRTMTSQAFGAIERTAPKGAVRYQYDGPKDKLTRPYCERMLARSRRAPLTRAQIEQTDNGQLPNPFLTCGGYNCRHQWIITEIKD